MGFGMVESACFHYTPVWGAVSMVCWLISALSLRSQSECGYWEEKNSLRADRFVNPASSPSGKESSLSRSSGILSRMDSRLSESELLSGTPSLMRASPPPAVMSQLRVPPSTAKALTALVRTIITTSSIAIARLARLFFSVAFRIHLFPPLHYNKLFELTEFSVPIHKCKWI